jgi:hypothetical protein
MASLTEAVASLNTEKDKVLEDVHRFAQENHVRCGGCMGVREGKGAPGGWIVLGVMVVGLWAAMG